MAYLFNSNFIALLIGLMCLSVTPVMAQSTPNSGELDQMEPFERNNKQLKAENAQSTELDPFEANNQSYRAKSASSDTTKPTGKSKPNKPVPQPPTQPVNQANPDLVNSGDPDEPGSPSRLSDTPLGLQIDDVPERPTPLLELGNPFLGVGPINLGFEIPTGSVWQPSVLIHGVYRSGFNVFERRRTNRVGRETVVEWANRLDIFANIQLAGFANERLVIGMRPLDRGLYNEPFSGWVFKPDDEDGEVNEFNDRITTLFFEGDLGEILPFLDEDDSASLDLGFSVGRQFFSAQNGVLLNDVIDMVGLTRNNIRVPFASNWRVTGIFGWNQINHGNFQRDDEAKLFGLFSSMDLRYATVDLDAVYISAPRDTRDSLHLAMSSVQRLFGSIATTVRAAVSLPLEGRQTAANTRGGLLVLESSWTPTGRDDVLFLNAYWGIDRYQSAARSPSTGGPLANIGILYAAPGLGRYPTALAEDPARSAGASVGYQAFLGSTSRQVIVEFGGRQDTSGRNQGMLALGCRIQQAFWQRFIIQADAFIAKQERMPEQTGTRIELQIQF